VTKNKISLQLVKQDTLASIPERITCVKFNREKILRLNTVVVTYE